MLRRDGFAAPAVVVTASADAARRFTNYRLPAVASSEVAGDERLHYDSADDYVR
ncbi:MAG: hypothetical protein V1790_10030 [Planctomycetota bacterium]